MFFLLFPQDLLDIERGDCVFCNQFITLDAFCDWAEELRKKQSFSGSLKYPDDFISIYNELNNNFAGGLEKQWLEVGWPEENIYIDNISVVASGFFISNYKTKSVCFPSCKIVDYRAFDNCENLIYVSLPNCTIISGYGFYNTGIQSLYLPECRSIEYGAFGNCKNLKTVSLPKCQILGHETFSRCFSLYDVSIPLCSTIGSGCFAFCYCLSSIALEKCVTLESYTFSGCINLSIIELSVCNYIGSYAFLNCSKLERVCLYYRGNSIPRMFTSVFYNTPIGNLNGEIYVPSQLLSQYQTASGWSTYSRIIKPL